MNEERIKVVEYSGYKVNERPVRFQIGGAELEVVEILDRWYGQEHDYFKVRASDNRVYILKWHRTLDFWSIQR